MFCSFKRSFVFLYLTLNQLAQLGVDGTPSQNETKRFCLQWTVESLWSSQQDEVILWVVVLLETCDVANNGRHLGRHIGFYKELEIRLKSL